MRAMLKHLLAGWTRMALVIQKTVTIVLFAAIYLLIVPWFALVAIPLDTMRLRSRPGQRTFWRTRRVVTHDESHFQRLG